MTNGIDRLQGRIWITERCHIKAEKRNRFLENYFHITLSLYAIASIAISLFDKSANPPIDDSLITFTSVCTLALSLLVFGFKFGEVAAQHRACYLGLQRLRLAQAESEDDLNQKYINTLSYYPNHSTSDYLDFAVSNVLFKEQVMKDAHGEPIRLPITTRLRYSFYWLTHRLIGLLFVAAPIELILISSGQWSIIGHLTK